jgi:nitrate reductase beta subunit
MEAKTSTVVVLLSNDSSPRFHEYYEEYEMLSQILCSAKLAKKVKTAKFC